MAEWKKVDTEENMEAAFISIRSMFLTGSVKKMYQLIDHNPTKLSLLLGMSYKSYHIKLQYPEKFSQMQIMTLSYAINIDPNLINDIIQKEVEKKVIEKFKKFRAKVNVKK